MKKSSEIGSEYYNLDISDKDILIGNDYYFTSSGRGALSLAVQNVSDGNKTVLLPMYTCSHIIEPFSWNGYKLQFYNIERSLSIDFEHFKNQILNKPSVVLIHNLYGFRNIAPNVLKLIEDFQARGGIVIEDTTHSLLNKWSPSYEKCNYEFASLRKWTGLADGGYLKTKVQDIDYPKNDMKEFWINRLCAQVYKKHYIENGSIDKETFLNLFNKSEACLDNDVSPYRVSPYSNEFVRKLDFKKIGSRRRANYRYLQENLDSDLIEKVFLDLKEESPIFFPVYVEKNRDEFRTKLTENDIYCPVHWPVARELKGLLTEDCEYIYNCIMSIPIDQRYDITDMKRIVDVVQKITLNILSRDEVNKYED